MAVVLVETECQAAMKRQPAKGIEGIAGYVWILPDDDQEEKKTEWNILRDYSLTRRYPPSFRASKRTSFHVNKPQLAIQLTAWVGERLPGGRKSVPC